MKYIKIISTLFAIVVIMFFLHCTISNKENLYASIGGTLLGFLGAFVIYQISVMIDEKHKKESKERNTKYIYQLYKMELEINKHHINDLINKKWIPFYKLKTITRDKLWGELADYCKDLNLMKKLQVAYGEFELINNKFDIMNSVRIHQKSTVNEKERTELSKELKEQLEGSIDLGQKVLNVIQESIGILDKPI